MSKLQKLLLSGVVGIVAVWALWFLLAFILPLNIFTFLLLFAGFIGCIVGTVFMIVFVWEKARVYDYLSNTFNTLKYKYNEWLNEEDK